jgi:hypothetical protein
MKNIPSEYLDFDFGFTGVSEEEYEGQIKRVEQSVSVEASQKIQEIEAEKDRAIGDLEGKIADLEKIIMPLLVNLLKTSEKEYIYWPNRAEKIQEQIDRVLELTRG